jgi:class 3 adenylate cyclase/tetratricopeptide (TPR) repeat protein
MTQPSVERRVVTALFVDVVGSAALGVRLGPERLKRVLERAFSELKAFIEAEGGTVEKYVGDAIHALFGTPVAHRDDPQRALRAAHACVRWAETSAPSSSTLAVRIGLETGEAIVDLAATEGGHQQMSVGLCVNLAARLQQAAEPGQVLVGPLCHQANAEIAEFAALGEVDLKGMGPVPAWRLVSLDAPTAGPRSPFVGRDDELDLLRLAYRRAQSGRSVLALISGPPGQGKTRLVEEFLRGAGAEAQLLTARCRPAGELGQRSPLHELLTLEGREASSEVLAERVQGLFADPLERHRVLTAFGFSAGAAAGRELAALTTAERLDEIANGWRRYLAALARQKPLVVWVDDLHWAEGEVVQLLDRLTFGAEFPFLVVATARPEFGAQAGLRPGGDRFFITLDPLDKDHARSLARHVGAVDASGLERAGGNPLFIIELARAREAGASDVPITLQGVIGARLDELAPGERELLQRASIVGETFTTRDAALLSSGDQADVDRMLARLVDLRYLYPADGRHRFHHALVRDVAYGRLTAAERMHLHARYAKEGVAADDAEALAHHYWEAVGHADAEWVWENGAELTAFRDLARDAHLAAARRYAARFAYERAIEAGRRALGFATAPLDVARAEQILAGIYGGSGDADEAATHYLRARDLYQAAGSEPPPDFYPSFLELPVYTAGMFMRPLSQTLVASLLDEGEGIARRAADAASLARLVALDAYRTHDASRLEAALRLADNVSDPTPLTSFLGHAAILQNRLGHFDAAQRTYERLDSVAAASGLTHQMLEFRAIFSLNTGNLAEGERLARDFLEVSRSRGPHLKTHAYREQSHVLLARGDWLGLRELAMETEQLVAAHPGTAFCYAVTTVQAFAIVADVLDRRTVGATSLLTRAEMPLQSEPFERESVLLLLYGATGRRDAVDLVLKQVAQRDIPPFWFFRRTEAVVLTMLERWDRVNEVLTAMDGRVESASPYLAALVSAIREEMIAAQGGPPPAHQRLRDLGYLGWSQLLAYRPLRASTSS